MYNKLFNKIVDSSIWMEPDEVRILFMMFIAIMDEDGFVNLASEKNVAHRAIMDLEAVKKALAVLEAPDPDSSNPANEGRRIERVTGGWMVLNSGEYRGLAKREHQKALNRERVRKHREKQRCNAPVTPPNESVTPSDTHAKANTEADAESIEEPKGSSQGASAPVWEELWKISPPLARKRSSKKQCKGAWGAIPANTRPTLEQATEALRAWMRDDDWRKENGKFIPGLHRWIANRQWENIDDIKNTTTAGIRARRKVSAAEMGL